MRRSQSHPVFVGLTHGRSLIASYSLAKSRSKRWVVLLTESAADFRSADRKELAHLVGTQVARHFNFLVVNKPGLSPGETDQESFEKSFRRNRRIEDSLAAMKFAIPKRHEIHLVGYSEGAYLAPQVATRDKRVASVSMIGGGTRGWLKEELNTASLSNKKKYKRKIKEIYLNPTSLEKWNGFSYATWYSYRGDNTLFALRKIKVPVLAILGARDRVIDLRSTIVDLVLISENHPVHINIFGDCGHYFSKHWGHVERVLGRFLTDNLRSLRWKKNTRL